MTRSLLVLGLVCSGCVVLPTTKTATRYAGTERSPVELGPVKAVSLQVASSRKNVSVRALSQRQCHTKIFAVTEVTESKGARFGVDDPRLRVLGLIPSLVTIPVSAIITGFIVAAADDQTSRVKTPLRTETTGCTTDTEGYALELTFPSGHVYRGKTDESGVLVASIPDDEPYVGDVAIASADATAQVHYEQALPPVTAARDALEGCLAGQQLAGAKLELGIDERGRVTELLLPTADAAVTTCVRKRITGVVFPSALRNATLVLPLDAPKM